jgi:hypothetical protein
LELEIVVLINTEDPLCAVHKQLVLWCGMNIASHNAFRVLSIFVPYFGALRAELLTAIIEMRILPMAAKNPNILMFISNRTRCILFISVMGGLNVSAMQWNGVDLGSCNDGERQGSSQYIVTSVTVRDAPRFRHRGLLIDTSRHFLPLRVIKV